ncbi:uncharacterized protein [Diadema setosum]|uniref:uncharacterized protein n=1 Tax=Diadema setosum TaxID=31175 RepID=UPI003B3A197D
MVFLFFETDLSLSSCGSIVAWMEWYGRITVYAWHLQTFSVCCCIASVVGTAPNVQGWKGQDILLPCDFQGEPFAVYWVKESTEGQQETKAGFVNKNFESLEERFDIDTNFSLAVIDLEVADEGLYLCQVALSNLEVFENSTLMTVNSIASSHVIEECVNEGLASQSLCTYQTPVDTPSLNLTCVVSGFKPNISMLWTDEAGRRLNPVVSQQTTLSDETYERLETITIPAERGTQHTFTCLAVGDSVNGTSTKDVAVLPISGNSNNLSLIIGLAIGVPVAAVVFLILLVGIFLRRHPPAFLRKGRGWYTRRGLFKTQQSDVDLLMIRSLPSHPSLTEEEVQQCKDDLKAYYSKTRRKVVLDPLNFMERADLDEIYTNLSLIDQSNMRKTHIAYDDLLKNADRGNLSKRLLIQGDGGVGKTTLCSKIAWDWCQGRIFQDLDMVIVIPLRDVKVDKTIGSIVERYLPHSNTATANKIDDYISRHLSKVILVFDGFDEFNGNIGGKSTSEIIRILGLEQYESCKVIVTSRPWRTDEFRLNKNLAEAYTFISVEGFNEENLRTYIKRYFQIREMDTLADTLLSFIEENDFIRYNMAPFPIYCAMLCLMWNDISVEKREKMPKLQTFSEIFGETITFLKEHYASKFCENSQHLDVAEHIKEASSAIEVISETALNGLLEKKLSFSEKPFESCQDAMEVCCRVGVLTIEKHIMNRRLRRDSDTSSYVVSTVSFPHKLFQEYVACFHLGHLFANDRPKYYKVKSQLLREYEEFRFLFYFAVAFEKELGLDIINSLMKKSDQYFCVDVAFECHTEEATRAIGEQWEEYRLLPNMSEHTKSGVVFLCHYNQVQSLFINKVTCGRNVSGDLAEVMHSSSKLHKVELQSPKFHSNFYRVIAAETLISCKITELNMSFDSLNGDYQEKSLMGKNLARWVCTMPELSRFSLTGHCMSDTFYSTVADFASSCQIKYLTLSFQSLDGDSQHQSSLGRNLARWVCTMPNLSSFSLLGHYLPDNFFSTAAELASSCQADLQCRNLPKNFFKTLASVVTSRKVNI